MKHRPGDPLPPGCSIWCHQDEGWVSWRAKVSMPGMSWWSIGCRDYDEAADEAWRWYRAQVRG